MKNETIKNILVPVDFTKTSAIALDEAITLAGLIKAKIHLIHVNEIDKYAYFVLPEDRTQMMVPANFDKAIKDNMEHLAQKVLDKTGTAAVQNITNGYVYEQITGYAKENKIDLIIMGTHGASGLNELFLGSNAQRVVTHSDVPVLTLQSKITAGGFKNILIPIDNSLHSREKVNIAMVFAALYKSEIHVVGLPNFNDTETLNSIQIKVDSVEAVVKENELSCKKSIIKGEQIAEGALKYAKSNNCDLIIINTGHESKISGAFLGAFAQQIVNHSPVPVLTFKHTDNHYLIETPGYGI